MTVSSAPPSGMRDFLPEELVRRRFVENAIRRIYESHGFVPVETPAMENLAALLGKYGDEGDQLLFRILHRREKLARTLEQETIQEKDLAETGLRYDLTVPLARLVANNRTLPRFFKRYQIQPVWRADRPGKGRFREFLQCDVDIIGTRSMIAEAEVCGAVAGVFRELGFPDFTIHLNHRKLLKAVIKAAGLLPEAEGTALVAVDKLDKIGPENVLKELEARGVGEAAAKSLLALLTRPEGLSEIQELERITQVVGMDPDSSAPLGELRELLGLLESTVAGGHVKIDVSLARGLGYYTGPIYEVKIPQAAGSLGGGGRYDGLIGMFIGHEIPAVGFSIGFERLVMIMGERNLFPVTGCGPQLLLCRFEEVPASVLLSVGRRLRSQGIKVEVFPETPKIGKQIAYAESIKAGTVGIIGSAEVAADSLTLKNLASGQQLTVKVDQAMETIRSWLTG